MQGSYNIKSCYDLIFWISVDSCMAFHLEVPTFVAVHTFRKRQQMCEQQQVKCL